MKIPNFFIRLTENLPFKLLSVAAAVLLYFSYQVLSLSSKSFSLPLQVREGGRFVLADEAPDFVRVSVRGRAEQIGAVQKSDIRAYIDTGAVNSGGDVVLPVKLELKEYFTLMEPLDVQVKPHRLNLKFEEKLYKSVPVHPFFLGSLPVGYEISSQVIEPENIKIAGARSMVESVNSVYTKSIDLQNVTESFTLVVNIDDSLKKVHFPDLNEVTVKIGVKAQILTKSFSVRAQVLSLDSYLEPVQELKMVTVVLSGTANTLSSFVPDAQLVQADFTGIDDAGICFVPLRINIPDEFSLISIDPPAFEVELTEKHSFVFPPEDSQDDEFGFGSVQNAGKAG